METILVVSIVLLWLLGLFNLLLTLALVRRINAASKSEATDASLEVGLQVGQIAPDFNAQTPDGEVVTRSHYAGRKVAFVFFSTHCRPCRELLPRLDLLKSGATLAGVELALVSSSPLEEIRSFIEQLDISLPVLVATRENSSFMEDYKSSVTPSYCLLDQQGTVQSAGVVNLEGKIWKNFADSSTKHDVSISSERR